MVGAERGPSADAGVAIDPHPGLSGAMDQVLPDGVALTVAAVARRIGVAPATLRTWDRRYGLGPSGHTAGAHRRYTAIDVSRLEHMRRLVNAGVPPGEAARAALVAPADPGAASSPVLPEPALDVDPWAEHDGDTHAHSRSGGGQVVAIPRGTPAARGLARAAMSLDGNAVTDIVRDTIDRRGVVWTWDHLLVPVLVGVGQRWASTGQGVEVEHLLSESVISVLKGVGDRLRSPANSRPVLLACVDEEMHSLPLFALSAALSERRIQARVLGARVPPSALVAAVRRTGPGAVVLWSHLPGPEGDATVPELPEMRPAPVLFSAGPGWSVEERGRRRHLSDLTEGVTAVSAAIGM